MSKKSDFGLIGLAVMGQNLVLNVESRGFQVSVYNRTTATTDEFIAKHPGKKLVGTKTLEEFVDSLATPRKIHIMVKSTAVADSDRDAVDAVIEQLIPLLAKDDIIIDGGNSFYKTTERRDTYLAEKGLRFIGSGVSGAGGGSTLEAVTSGGGSLSKMSSSAGGGADASVGVAAASPSPLGVSGGSSSGRFGSFSSATPA